METPRLMDRADAGRQLAQALRSYQRENAIVLGLPRGGVLVAKEVSRILGKPLDVMVVRKVGVPWHPELAIGAVGPKGVLFLNHDLMQQLHLDLAQLEDPILRERAELERRLQLFRDGRPFPDLRDKTAILVDDGLATGATARAAIAATRALGAGKIVLAVPVGAYATVSDLRHEVDELVCLQAPDDFQAVSLWYERFPQNSDAEVVGLLQQVWRDQDQKAGSY